ncbi:hypothetical protein H2203_003693 [Taxawa tesnikishii (nom. ined.)]|nr:hypothetical protein H2203_003693 [Dothideales sp. JES 119]
MFRRGTSSTNTTPNRYGRPRGSSHGSRRGGANTTKHKGAFENSIWLCNCTPRLPAEHFKVRKEGRNQGRWFYTCQNAELMRCDFFLWDEDAKPRMESAVLGNSRSENITEGNGRGRTIGQVERSESQRTTASPSPSPLLARSIRDVGRDSQTKHAKSIGAKRKIQEMGFDDDDEDTFPGLSRAKKRTDAYATPSTISTRTRKLPWLDYSTETPQSKTASLNNPISPTKSLTSIAFEALPTPTSAGKMLGLPETTDTTPTPSRYKDALSAPTTPATPSMPSVKDEVLTLLASTTATLPANIASQLCSILTKHDNRAQGAVKGRDAVRTALRTKDAKITELQARIDGLEADRELDKAVIRKLRFESAEKARRAKQTKLDFTTPGKGAG